MLGVRSAQRGLLDPSAIISVVHFSSAQWYVLPPPLTDGQFRRRGGLASIREPPSMKKLIIISRRLDY